MTGPEVKPFCELVRELQDPRLPLTAETVRKLVDTTPSAEEATVKSLGYFAKCTRGCLVRFKSTEEFVPPTNCQRNQLGSLATNQVLAA